MVGVHPAARRARDSSLPTRSGGHVLLPVLPRASEPGAAGQLAGDTPAPPAVTSPPLTSQAALCGWRSGSALPQVNTRSLSGNLKAGESGQRSPKQESWKRTCWLFVRLALSSESESARSAGLCPEVDRSSSLSWRCVSICSHHVARAREPDSVCVRGGDGGRGWGGAGGCQGSLGSLMMKSKRATRR